MKAIDYYGKYQDRNREVEQEEQPPRARGTELRGCLNCTAGDGEHTVLLAKWGEEDFCPMCGRPLKGADNEQRNG